MTHRFTDDLRKLERDSHDTCSLCGQAFREGDTAHSGYSDAGVPLFVGECCSAQVDETAVRYRWSPLPYEVPPPENALWRYMDLSKFIGLLRDQSLYFARLDHLRDPWEGAKGDVSNKSVWDSHYLKFFQKAIRNPPEGFLCEKSDEEIKAESERLLRDLNTGGNNKQRTTYVSCWHENETESEALWRLYCPPTTTGVAIKITTGGLKRVFDKDFSVQIGRVKYIDFRTQFAGINDSVFRKRKSLQHEQEVRAVIRHHTASREVGLTRAVNLNLLVQEVVLSPFTAPWFESVVRDLLQRYGVTIPVRTSELLSHPFF